MTYIANKANQFRAFRVQTMMQDAYGAESISDLLTDILHYCEQEGITLQEEMLFAHTNFKAEATGEE